MCRLFIVTDNYGEHWVCFHRLIRLTLQIPPRKYFNPTSYDKKLADERFMRTYNQLSCRDKCTLPRLNKTVYINLHGTFCYLAKCLWEKRAQPRRVEQIIGAIYSIIVGKGPYYLTASNSSSSNEGYNNPTVSSFPTGFNGMWLNRLRNQTNYHKRNVILSLKMSMRNFRCQYVNSKTATKIAFSLIANMQSAVPSNVSNSNSCNNNVAFPMVDTNNAAGTTPHCIAVNQLTRFTSSPHLLAALPTSEAIVPVAEPQTGITVSQNDITAPQNNHAAPQNEHTEPQNNITAPRTNHTVPKNNHTAPLNDHTVLLQNDAKTLQNGTTAPRNDITALSTDTTVPQNNTEASQNDITASPTGTTAPQNDQIAPLNDITASQNDTTVPQNNTDAPQNDITAPHNDIIGSHNDTEAPQNDITVPQNNTEAPQNDTEAPQNDTEAQQNHIEAPQNDITAPDNTEAPQNDTEATQNNTEVTQNDTEAPQNDTEAPQNDTTAPQNNTEAPQNDITVPHNDTEVPQNDQIAPLNDITASQNDTTVPQNNTDAPQNDITAPHNDIIAPQDDLTSSQTGITAPHNDTKASHNDIKVPQNNITAPQLDITAPQSDTTAPQNDTTALQTDTTAPQNDNRLCLQANDINVISNVAYIDNVYEDDNNFVDVETCSNTTEVELESCIQEANNISAIRITGQKRKHIEYNNNNGNDDNSCTLSKVYRSPRDVYTEALSSESSIGSLTAEVLTNSSKKMVPEKITIFGTHATTATTGTVSSSNETNNITQWVGDEKYTESHSRITWADLEQETHHLRALNERMTYALSKSNEEKDQLHTRIHSLIANKTRLSRKYTRNLARHQTYAIQLHKWALNQHAVMEKQNLAYLKQLQDYHIYQTQQIQRAMMRSTAIPMMSPATTLWFKDTQQTQWLVPSTIPTSTVPVSVGNIIESTTLEQPSPLPSSLLTRQSLCQQQQRQAVNHPTTTYKDLGPEAQSALSSPMHSHYENGDNVKTDKHDSFEDVLSGLDYNEMMRWAGSITEDNGYDYANNAATTVTYEV